MGRFQFFVEHKKDGEKKSGDTNVSQSGQGTASGRDTTYQGPVNYGPSPRPLTTQLAAKDAQIADLMNLTKLLLEKNASTAAPGAQQAVGEAIQSIAQGAAEGDTRLQQALELLKANKTTEAEPLLQAFAKDKTVRIEQDRKEAAIAYRNLASASI